MFHSNKRISIKNKNNDEMTIDNYNQKLSTLIKSHKHKEAKILNEAEMLYEEIGKNADNYTHNIMLKLYANLGDISNAKRIFNKIVQDQKTYHVNGDMTNAMLLNAYAKAPKITHEIFEEAESFYQSVREADVVKSVMINFYSRMETITLDIVARIENIYFSISEVENTNKVQMLIIYSHLKPPIPDSIIINAEKIYSSLNEIQYFSLHMLLKIFSHAKNVTIELIMRAKHISYKTLEAKHLLIDPKNEQGLIILNTLLKIHAAVENITDEIIQSADEIYLSVPKKNMTILSTMIFIHSKAKGLSSNEIKKIEDMYFALDNKSRFDVCALILNAYANAANVTNELIEKAENIYYSLRAPLLLVSNIMLKIYANVKNSDENILQKAEDLFLKIDDAADIITFTTMITAYSNAEVVDENILYKADQLLEKFKDKMDFASLIIMLNFYTRAEVIPTHFLKNAEYIFNLLNATENSSSKAVMVNIYAKIENITPQIIAKAENIATKEINNSIIASTLINVYANAEVVTKELIRKAENIHKSLGKDASDRCTSTLIKVYANAEIVSEDIIEKAEHLKLRLTTGNDIYSCNSLLNVYANAEKVTSEILEKAKHLYITLGDGVNNITLTTMLKLYSNFEKISEEYVEALEEFFRKHDMKNVITYKLICKLYKKIEKYDRAQAFLNIYLHNDPDYIFERIDLFKLKLKSFAIKDYSTFSADLQEIEKIACNDNYRELCLVAYAYHLFIEKIAIKSKNAKSKRRNQKEIINFKLKITDHLKSAIKLLLNDPQYDKIKSLSILNAWLFNLYLPAFDIAPKHQSITKDEIKKIQKLVFAELNHDLIPLNTDKERFISINIVNTAGKIIGKHIYNDSIYHVLTAGKIKMPVFVKIERMMKPQQLPFYITVKEAGKIQIYVTTLFGGSKLKTKVSQKDYGELIGVPIESVPFFNELITFDEGRQYAQRAILPESENKITLGAKGKFNMVVMPYKNWYAIPTKPFIVEDGCGYIKRSVAELMGVNCNVDRSNLDWKESPLIFQALHAYKNKNVAKEIAELAYKKICKHKEIFIKIKNHEQLTDPENQILYDILKSSVPKTFALGIPVKDSSVLLPDTPAAHELARAGLMAGRSPYSEKKLQAISSDEIKYDNDLNKLQVFQYTLSGQGKFYKGLYVVIDDKDWPLEYKDQDIIVCSKDLKLSHDWKCFADKVAAIEIENPYIQQMIGMLVVKQTYEKMPLIGLHPAVANKLTGDFDGDLYDFLSAYILPELMLMIREENKNPNNFSHSKLTKTFTPVVSETSMGKSENLFKLRSCVLEEWVMIGNKIYNLSDAERLAVVKELSQDNIISDVLGKRWHKKYKLSPDQMSDEAKVIIEIQIGIRCGEDGPKTKVPTQLLLERARAYNVILRKYRPEFRINYGKSIQKRLDSKDIMKWFDEIIQDKRPENVVAKAQRKICKYIQRQLFFGNNIEFPEIPKAENIPVNHRECIGENDTVIIKYNDANHGENIIYADSNVVNNIPIVNAKIEDANLENDEQVGVGFGFPQCKIL